MNAFQGWTVVFMGPSPTGKHLLLARVRPGAALSTVRIPIAHDGKHCPFVDVAAAAAAAWLL
jgi:putative ribosome biogenesis GTPase RsgA